MRIATANSFDNSIETLMRRQTSLVETQEQLTTGKRVNRASDDPAAAARAERALAREGHIDATKRGVAASENAMRQAETALGDAGELMQQIRETMVAAGNGSYTDAERAGLADKIAGLRDQLFQVANRRDSGGNYLFAGQAASHAPFVDGTGGVTYAGATGHLDAATGDPLPLTVDGHAAWMSARTGNGVFTTNPAAGNTGRAWVDTGRVTDPSALTGSNYSIVFADAGGGAHTYSVLRDGAATGVAGAPYVPGRSIEIDGLAATVSGTPADGDTFELAPSTADLNIFDEIDGAVAALKTPMRPRSEIEQTNSRYLGSLDQAMGQLQSMRSRVGETLTRIDNATGRLDDQRLAAKTERSNAEDLDMVEALSEFQNKQTGYDAALKSYSLVQKLSLFNYIS